jgi:hypothetical protein
MLWYFFLSIRFIFISYYYSVNFNLCKFVFLASFHYDVIPSYEFFLFKCSCAIFIILSFNSHVVFTNRQRLRISKSMTEKFRFDCKIKIRLLHNFVPLCNSRPWHRHSSPYPCYATGNVLDLPLWDFFCVCIHDIDQRDCSDNFNRKIFPVGNVVLSVH